MHRIPTYIAKQLFSWIGIALGGLILSFIITQVLRVAPLFVGANVPAAELLTVMALVVLPITAWSLTPAFAIAAFATAGRMRAEGELVAAHASGIGHPTLLLGPAATALVLSVFSAWLWLQGGPSAHRLLNRKVTEIAGSALLGQLREGVFQEPIPGIVFFGNEKISPHKFGGILLEDGRTRQRKVHYVAKSLAFNYRAKSQTISFSLEEGTAFVSSPLSQDPPLAISFGELTLTVDIAGELESRLDFLPATLSHSTARLLGPPPPHHGINEWEYAFWRRLANPLGFLLFSLLASVIAFQSSAERVGGSIFRGAVLFLFYHLSARWAESMMVQGAIGAKAAAMLPVSLTLAVLFILLSLMFVARTPRKRLSRRI